MPVSARPALRPVFAAATAFAAFAALAPGVTGAAAVDARAHAARTLNLSAASNDTLAFNKKRLSVSAGSVTLKMKNPSNLPHAIAIGKRKGATVNKGDASKVTATLKTGTYTYFCPVKGPGFNHRAGGMTGKLTVK